MITKNAFCMLVPVLGLASLGACATTGSSIVRRIAPGDTTTKDFREERVTVTIVNGQVVAPSCG
ncbi:hypothetical protein QP164_19400 [Sphingomonas sp. LR59]|uniref:hypothetical protein n=1 Tax=Sphingomonas sp. LR59 TaxID=3050232 RepID=UPI002FE25B85